VGTRPARNPLSPRPGRKRTLEQLLRDLEPGPPWPPRAATGRGEAQVLRLSALYAALDCSSIIRLPHLEAALTLWDYCSYSATSLFGSCVGDSIADRIREALQASPGGLSRTEIWNLFRGHLSSDSIVQALERLSSLQLVTSRYVSGRGRPTTLWSTTDCEYTEPAQQDADEDEESWEEPT
jgi:hypothetical protein